MKTAIILHGKPGREEYFDPNIPSPSNHHWLPWLQHELLLEGILAQTPELPEPYEADYEEWRKAFEQFPVTEDTMLVGHSCGGGFLVRWLSEGKVRVGKVALVAPWINKDTQEVKPGFFDFELDEALAERTKGIALFYSRDDDAEILETANMLKERLRGLQVQEFADKGHFTLNDLDTDQLPEVRDWLLHWEL